jgi:hypothetical protein
MAAGSAARDVSWVSLKGSAVAVKGFCEVVLLIRVQGAKK